MGLSAANSTIGRASAFAVAGTLFGVGLTVFTIKPWIDKNWVEAGQQGEQFTFSASKEALANARFNIQQLEELKTALEKYRKDIGKYPVPAKMTRIVDVLNVLEPDYISSLGIFRFRDGKGVSLYVSDGKDYKLILYRSGDCYLMRFLSPQNIDPVRSSGEIDCEAYGIWTAGVVTKW